MKDLIDPIPKEKIEKELTEDKLLRHTNNGNNLVYVITHHNAPNTMLEIGRLREITFRQAGGGTGKDADIDSYDTAENPYKQLIVWDPEDKEIMGGYRFHKCHGDSHPEHVATAKMFHFSEKFKKDYFPYMIELGRSFIQPNFQSTNPGRKALYALDNLWDGLGALVVENPEIKYFFGKVTMYKHFNPKARNLIMAFLQKYFPDKEQLVRPNEPLELGENLNEIEKTFTNNDFKADYKLLSQQVRQLDENIPPLINAYMNLSSSMKVFGTATNYSFGGVEETGIMITIADVYPQKVERHIQTYIKEKENK